MRHEVIICTKDRPEELQRCLAALSVQTASPDRILVVDGSEPPIRDVPTSAGPCSVVHLTSPAGLTRQRNLGLRSLDHGTEIVHFLDDDAVPEPEYCAEVIRAFQEWPDAAGVGGRITNLPQHKPWRIERFVASNSRRQGALLRSGVNILSFDGPDSEVDWLSGCAMSFRVRCLAGLEFDERRSGNGLGEDVDFTARVRVRGTLVWRSSARVAHVQSPVNRDAQATLVRRDVHHRWMLATDRVGAVRRWWVVYATLGMIAVNLGRGLRRRSRSPLRHAGAGARGLLDLARLKVSGRPR